MSVRVQTTLKPNSICVQNERDHCQDLSRIDNTDSDLKVRGCILQTCTRQSFLSKTSANSLNMQKLQTIRKNVWEKCNDAFSSIRVQTTKNRISFFFLLQYQRQRKWFFRARAAKGIARQIDASSVVSTLIDNGKLAYQIARLAAIVVTFSLSIRPSTKALHSGLQ